MYIIDFYGLPAECYDTITCFALHVFIFLYMHYWLSLIFVSDPLTVLIRWSYLLVGRGILIPM